MEDLTRLQDLLTLLTDAGVTRYRQGDLELELSPRPPAAPAREDQEPSSPRPRPATPYHDPALWPGGAPPSFRGDQ